MKVGLMLNTQFAPGTDMRARVPEMIEQVRVARECGFASLWFPHHYLTSPLQMFQLTAVLPFLLHEAKGMLVGGDIMVLPLLNPVSVAEEAATLDVLSDGHYVLGVGLGYRDVEYEAFGIPMSERVPRFIESLELIRRLWTEDLVSHQGRFYKVTNAGVGLKPVRPNGPLVWIGGQVEAAIRRAALLGDAWIMVPTMTIDTLETMIKLYREARAEGGRAPAEDFPLFRECYVGRSHAIALEECRAPLMYKYDSYKSWGQHAQRDQTRPPLEEFAQDRFIIGDQAFVKEDIERYRAIGVNHFIMRCQWPGLEHQRVLCSIRALGEIFA